MIFNFTFLTDAQCFVTMCILSCVLFTSDSSIYSLIMAVRYSETGNVYSVVIYQIIEDRY